jgi:hypothetical protein
MWATSAIKKTKQSKQSPIGRKFAQSGHSGQVEVLLRPWVQGDQIFAYWVTVYVCNMGNFLFKM